MNCESRINSQGLWNQPLHLELMPGLEASDKKLSRKPTPEDAKPIIISCNLKLTFAMLFAKSCQINLFYLFLQIAQIESVEKIFTVYLCRTQDDKKKKKKHERGINKNELLKM